MEIGKLPNEVLKRVLFDRMNTMRPEVIEGAGIGKDTATVDFGDDYIIVSCDPITGATENLGKLALNIACNDLATKGAQPVCALTSILLPPSTEESEFESLMDELVKEAKVLKIDLIGGHTEVTDAVNRIIITTTVMGRLGKDEVMEDAVSGDLIVVTKNVGIEGTSILAYEREHLLSHMMSGSEREYARHMADDLSVVKEGMIAKLYNVKYMHDITEGGVLGAAWETAEAIEQGIMIFEDRIPLDDITVKICEILKIDPLKLISSGSMLMVIGQLDYVRLQERLDREGIMSTVIGRVTDFDGAYMSEDGNVKLITPPGSDELYKVY